MLIDIAVYIPRGDGLTTTALGSYKEIARYLSGVVPAIGQEIATMGGSPDYSVRVVRVRHGVRVLHSAPSQQTTAEVWCELIPRG